jgi:pimeloyl-ACP methyl ester carboxylesterase
MLLTSSDHRRASLTDIGRARPGALVSTKCGGVSTVAHVNPMSRIFLSVVVCFAATGFQITVAADRVAPPKSEVVVPADVRDDLKVGLIGLRQAIDNAAEKTSKQPALNKLLPDIEIYFKAVDWALRYDEFYKTNEFKVAAELLETGKERAAQLASGVAPWTESTGLVVRGYRSRIDGSVQPYGLVIPDTWRKETAQQFRLDVWLHGREDKLTELKFIDQRQRSRGEFTPVNTFVLHAYGRYCNAFKFAGETDVFEAMEHARSQYPIDDSRLAIRGFSMGGGGCWHLAAHHPGGWAAAAPGAGFSESAEYLGKLKKEPFPPRWEQSLWGLYNATDAALNFFNLPVVAYNGDQDSQKQAADMMQAAMLQDGIHLARVTGRNVGHKYTPAAKTELSQKIDAIVAVGKHEVPAKVKFKTATLRYPESHWVRLEGLDEHWKIARVDAELFPNDKVAVNLTNVSAFSLNFDAGDCPLSTIGPVQVEINGQVVSANGPMSDRSWHGRFENQNGGWKFVEQFAGGLKKRPGLQGPIDDTWFDSFIMVEPSGEGFHGETDAWVKRELDWMQTNWRGTFRGEAPLKSADAITDADIANSHLILWGDPKSNPLIAKILGELPLKWAADKVVLKGEEASSSENVPVMVFPNPLNPKKYVVLNSGFTFRAFGSNADQTPKLPDYAIIDITKPSTGIAPGGVVVAGFFDEAWR